MRREYKWTALRDLIYWRPDDNRIYSIWFLLGSMHMTADARIDSFYLQGPGGRLEALLNVGDPDAAFAAVVAHPHPLFGGTMHNKVVYHTMKALNVLGLPVLRFNFRGAGSSQGEHDYGRGEVEDVLAALDWLATEYGKPIIFAGFSFGAAVGLRAACPDPRVAAVIALGMPINADGRVYIYEHLVECAKPKLLVSGENDEFAPRQALAEVVAKLPEPKRFILIQSADHFFAGHLQELRTVVESWTRELLRDGRVAV